MGELDGSHLSDVRCPRCYKLLCRVGGEHYMVEGYCKRCDVTVYQTTRPIRIAPETLPDFPEVAGRDSAAELPTPPK